MTDDEIIAAFKKGHDLLEQYKATVLPAAAALAKKKSLAVFGEEGAYEGKLGCFDTGIEVVCMHRAEKFRGKQWEEDRPFEEKSHAFNDEWFQKVWNSGVSNLQLGGYY